MAASSASVSVSTGEREGEPEKEGRKRREWRGVQGSLQGSSRRFGGKQEVALATSRSRARRCFPGLNEEDKANLHIAP
jgi:hypothetical protein